MKTNRKELLRVLNLVKPGLSTKETIEQMSHFIFTGAEVVTFNDQICVSHPLDTDFTCTIKAKILLDLLSNISSEDVELAVKDTELKINGKKTKGGIVLVAEDEIFPLIDAVRDTMPEEFFELPPDLLGALKTAVFSASRDESKGVFACVRAAGKEVMSSDRKRISRILLEHEVPEEFLLKASSIRNLPDDLTMYIPTERWVHFANDSGVIFSVKRDIGEFPDYTDIYKNFSEVLRTEIPSGELQVALHTVGSISEDSMADKQVAIRIGDNQIVCRSETEEGWVETEIDFDYSKEPVEFCLNPLFLHDILQNCNTIMVGEKACLFQSENFEHMIARVV